MSSLAPHIPAATSPSPRASQASHSCNAVNRSRGEGRGEGRPSIAIDVRVRLLITLVLLLALLSTSRLHLPALVFLASSLLCLRLTGPTFLRRLLAPLGASLLLCLTRTLVVGSTPLFHLYHVTFYREGLYDGLLLGLRVLAAAAVLLALCSSTTVPALLAALRWLRVPAAWVHIALLMHRYVFCLFDQATTVLDAQKVRLGYRTWRAAAVSAGSLGGIVLLRSIDQAERLHEAMAARGFHGEMPIAPLPPLSRRQLAGVAAALLLVTLLLLILERGLI